MRTKTTTKRDSLLSVGVGATLTVALTSTMGAYAAGPADDELAAEAVTPPAPRSLDGLIDRLDTLERDNSYLQAEVEQLRQEAGQEWLTEKRSAEIRGLVQDVLADSSSRMSLQDSAATAGWDAGRGFYLRSSDNRFMLQVGGLVQARYVFNYASDSPGFTNNTNTTLGNNRFNNAQRNSGSAFGFDLPHTRLVFKGHVFEPGIRFYLRTQFSPIGVYTPGTEYRTSSNVGALDLLDAYIAFDLDNQWTVRVGQFKLPFSRERLVSVQNLLTADRSSVDTLMAVGRSQAIELSTRTDSFYWAVALSDGGSDNLLAGVSNNSGYFPVGTEPMNTPFWDQQATFAITSRVEFKLSGDWADFKEMTSPMGSAPGLLLGLAGHYQMGQAPYGPGPGGYTTYSGGGNNEWINFTADASWNLGGATVYGAVYYSNSETKWSALRASPAGARRFLQGTTNLLGLMLQGSMYVAPKWEVFARYQYMDTVTAPNIGQVPPSQAPIEFSPLSIATIGVNWYIDGQDLRWNFQVGYAFNEVTMVNATPENGFRSLFRGTNELVLLSQIQLQF